MNITVVYQYYQGHDAPGHSLVYELTQFLANQGHKVSVVSGENGYMQRDASSLPWYRRLVRKERDGKVDVVRTFTYSESHRSYLGRLLGFLSFSLSSPLGLAIIDKPDVVLASSPPLFPMLPAWLFCKLRRIPFVIEVRDLWPASAVQMGIVKNGWLIRTMAGIERLLYDKAERIIALTKGIQSDIRVRGWPTDKVNLITCGVDIDKLYPDANGAASIRSRYRWQSKKIILYFGAMGEANNLPVTLRAAQRLRHRTDILFVLIGDGMKRNDMQKQIAAMGLSNLVLLPPVPKNEARQYICAADLCLVTLRDIPLFNGAIPTKLIDYMACGKPVLCGVRGEARRILESAGAGMAFEPDDDAQLSGLIVELLSNASKTELMGRHGRDYVQRHFDADAIRENMNAILVDVVERFGRKQRVGKQACRENADEF